MRFRCFGVTFRVSFWFFAVILCFLMADRYVLFRYLALPVLFHEASHLLAILACGATVESVALTPFSVNIQKGSDRELGYGREMLIASAGIIGNLLIAGGCYLFCFPSMRMMFFIAANVAMALFNLLPIGSLDGGQIIRLLTERLTDPQMAFRISQITSFAVLVPMFAFSFLLLLQGRTNITLLIVCLYLTFVVIFRN